MIDELLKKDPAKRLGCKNDSEDIKKHPFFCGITWEYIIEKKYEPPYIPTISNDLGLSHFDPEFTEIPVNSVESKTEIICEKSFDQFSFTY